jgi:protein-disulfide isomerase
MSISRRVLVAGLAGFPFTAQAQTAQEKAEFYPIPVELIAGLDKLQGTVTLGNPAADVRLYEFFDYNCGYCRKTVRDIRPLLAANKDLAVVLVNYAVLGIPSIGATRVALAFSMQKAANYLAFHEALFARRGTIDADQAIDVALKHGANKARLVEDADSDPVTSAMKTAAKLGETFGFQATPSYLVGRDGFSGFLDAKQKLAAIAAFRKCERAACV